jgi:hypothetical protein
LLKKKKLNIILVCFVSLIAIFMASGKPASASMFDTDPNPDLEGATAAIPVGDDVTAYFFEDEGLLYITGTGVADVRRDGFAYSNPIRPIGNGIHRVYFADGITEIGADFLSDSAANSYYPNLTEVRLPETLEKIDHWAFSYIYTLTTVNFPDSLAYIGRGAFVRCMSLEVTELPPNLETIKENAFFDNRALSLTELPDSLTEIGESAFFNSGIRISRIPDGVTTLGASTFSLCYQITSLDLNNVTALTSKSSGASGAFLSCLNLRSVMGANLEYIRLYTFPLPPPFPVRPTATHNNHHLCRGVSWSLRVCG